MKHLLIYVFGAVVLFGCSGNEQVSDTSEVVTSESETMTEDTPMTFEKPDIVALASQTPELSTLVQALQGADLVTALQGEGPYTVFAPTNEAFAALPAGTLDNLMKPENKQQLADILTYHVAEGNVMAADLSDGMAVKTLNGKELKVMLGGEKVMINDATVTTPNVEASNGVVHIVDKVILPAAN
ncbi:fasciclin domain-containing protein [Pontibacter sp. CAU 1760]